MHYARYQPLKRRPPGGGAFFDYVEDVLRRATPTPRSCRIDRRERYRGLARLTADAMAELAHDA